MRHGTAKYSGGFYVKDLIRYSCDRFANIKIIIFNIKLYK